MAKACIVRLKGICDIDLVEAVASQSSETAKQICLYAMMKQYRLVWDFMITVIGEKYRMQNFSFSQMDVNVFSCSFRNRMIMWLDGVRAR